MTEKFTITFEAETPHPIEPAIRLRQLLKMAGRAFAMRCVDIHETHAKPVELRSGEEHPLNHQKRASFAGAGCNETLRTLPAVKHTGLAGAGRVVPRACFQNIERPNGRKVNQMDFASESLTTAGQAMACKSMGKPVTTARPSIATKSLGSSRIVSHGFGASPWDSMKKAKVIFTGILARMAGKGIDISEVELDDLCKMDDAKAEFEEIAALNLGGFTEDDFGYVAGDSHDRRRTRTKAAFFLAQILVEQKLDSIKKLASTFRRRGALGGDELSMAMQISEISNH